MAIDIKLSQTLMNVASIATNTLTEDYEGSLIEYGSVARNAILVTIEDSLTHHDVIPDIMKFSTNLYAGWYLRAVAMQNVVGNVRVREVLDRLNTKRDVVSNALDNKWVSVESYNRYPKFTAYVPANYSQESFIPAYALEALGDYTRTGWDGEDVEGSKPTASAQEKNLVKTLTEAPHLAQGKIFEVTIEHNNKQARIPAEVVLNPAVCNKQMFIAMYAQANQNNTMVNRFRRWMDGELSTLADMIFVNDIVSDYAKLIKQDKNKLVTELEKRRRANKTSTLLTGKTSLATASTISIISKSTMAEIEMAVGGKITDFKVRQDIFGRSGLTMLVVVDDMYETVTLFYRGQERSQELTFKECKFAAKGNGPDPMEILKVFQQGQIPNI